MLNWTITRDLGNLGKGQLPQSIIQEVKVMALERQFNEARAFTFTWKSYQGMDPF